MGKHRADVYTLPAPPISSDPTLHAVHPHQGRSTQRTRSSTLPPASCCSTRPLRTSVLETPLSEPRASSSPPWPYGVFERYNAVVDTCTVSWTANNALKESARSACFKTKSRGDTLNVSQRVRRETMKTVRLSPKALGRTYIARESPLDTSCFRAAQSLYSARVQHAITLYEYEKHSPRCVPASVLSGIG